MRQLPHKRIALRSLLKSKYNRNVRLLASLIGFCYNSLMRESKKIITLGQQFGFDLIGIIPVKHSPNANYLEEWLKKGFAGEMEWIGRALEKRKNPLQVFPQAKSIMVLGLNYFIQDIPKELKNDPSLGIIAKYALIDDYHPVVLNHLERFTEEISKNLKKKISYKAYVDTGPILERELAHKAGLGFIGNNTNLVNYQLGSYLFIGEILVDAEFETYVGKVVGSCGVCQACLNNCPTGALVDKKILDARKCVSYLTIELKDEIPEELRPLMRNRIFGCDICQDVCPWNSKSKPNSFFQTTEGENTYSRLQKKMAPPLLELAYLSQAEFNIRFKNSPIKRAKYKGFLRNVAVALGNWGDKKALPALEKLIRNKEPLVRLHATWAKRQLLL